MKRLRGLKTVDETKGLRDGLLTSYLRNRRMEVIRPYLIGKGLDYGCEVGALMEMGDMKPDCYVGVDIDEESIEIARKRYPQFRFEVDVEKNKN